MNYFIGEEDFRVWLQDVAFIKSSESNEEDYNSRKIKGIMSTQRKDRQDENVLAKGLEFDEFLHSGHFNDNHSQETSAIVGYPEKVQYHTSLDNNHGIKAPGWTVEGYVLKGTKRADGIWELARSLTDNPHKKLGFSIEGKVLRRSDKTIERAKIRNVAITNCPVNTDCCWDLLAKSMTEPEWAVKSMMAGSATSPATQSGGGALRTESLDKDVKDVQAKKKKRVEALMRAIQIEDMAKAMDIVMEQRPDFDEEAAAFFVNHLFMNGGK